jgi:hypothetical protein
MAKFFPPFFLSSPAYAAVRAAKGKMHAHKPRAPDCSGSAAQNNPLSLQQEKGGRQKAETKSAPGLRGGRNASALDRAAHWAVKK